jgi:CsoR family transcriptional regulator, copper-sensing transcriptional repressor
MGSRGRRDTHRIEHTFESQDLRLVPIEAVDEPAALRRTCVSRRPRTPTVDNRNGGKYPPRVCCERRARRRAQARQEDRNVYGYGPKKKEYQDRLRRIEGQVRGLQRMVDEDQYCIDILTQVNSVRSALKAVAMGLLDEHVRHCVRESIERGEGDEKMEELMSAVARFAGR